MSDYQIQAAGRLDDLRRRLPDAMGAATQVVVDNPAQMLLIISGSFVITRALGTLVRPRTPLQAILTATAAYALSMAALNEARRRRLLVLRVRDEYGQLVAVPFPVRGSDAPASP